jgi:hypothetical protein
LKCFKPRNLRSQFCRYRAHSNEPGSGVSAMTTAQLQTQNTDPSTGDLGMPTLHRPNERSEHTEFAKSFQTLVDEMNALVVAINSAHANGTLTFDNERDLLRRLDSITARLYQHSGSILVKACNDSAWEELKARVVLHYAEPEGDIVHFAAISLAKSVLQRLESQSVKSS